MRNKITYVSNAGILLELYDKKILIDAFCNAEMVIYKKTDDIIRNKIINNLYPYNDIDLILFTHCHSDHFDINSTLSYLLKNKETPIISTPQVIDEIKNSLNNQNEFNLIQLCPKLYESEKIEVDGIYIEGISMIHDGEKYRDIQNLAYIIEVKNRRIMHTGDSKPSEENYKKLNLNIENINSLIAPFPYIGILPGRKVIEKYIKPEIVICVHMPYKNLDEFGWINATKRSYNRVKKDFIETIFLENLGESINLNIVQ